MICSVGLSLLRGAGGARQFTRRIFAEGAHIERLTGPPARPMWLTIEGIKRDHFTIQAYVLEVYVMQATVRW